MALEIASIGQMVMIPTNVELVVRDVFMAPVRIITQLAIQSGTMKPVASAAQTLASIALTTMMGVAVTREFAIAVRLKNQFGVALTGDVLVCVSMMLLASGNQHPIPRWLLNLPLKKEIQEKSCLMK